MSLVAYGASSDEDSECEEIAKETQVQPQQSANTSTKNETTANKQIPGTVDDIEDDDDDIPQPSSSSKFKLNLPQPKTQQKGIVEEEDDEFLHKKVPTALIERPVPQKPKIPARKPVQITIPSMADFKDDTDKGPKKTISVGPRPMKATGLLGMLPAPKTEVFMKKIEPSPAANESNPKAPVAKTNFLVPHSVANRLKAAHAKPSGLAAAATDGKKPPLGLNYANSDDSDSDGDNGGGFFSFAGDDKLPEVSAAEIKAMVAKKADQMTEYSKKLDQADKPQPVNVDYVYVEPVATAHSSQRELYNIEALVGARAAKRTRYDDIQFIDISQDQVKPSQDEWMRTSLQAETEPQQRGALPIAPGAGTKKKHQITYLAYQAKANEQELQATWAANRQSRRQTQSKYGF